MKNKIHLPELIGKGYKDFWLFKGRYRVVKGSRASKKSKTTALYYIYSIMKYPKANLLVIRKTFRSLKSSCYTELRWAINTLCVSQYFDCKESPLEITYIPTGQKIYFRGLDDPLKTTSITVENGHLCWLWIEEAYEINREDHFDTIDESIRGKVSDDLFKQITLTFNPWNEKHWLKSRFFDNQNDDVLAKTTNYLCNEWLDEADLKLFETMRVNNPKRYKVAGLGDWGIVDGLVYNNWREEYFNIEKIKTIPNIQSVFGLDFGYINDPTALFCGFIDTTNYKIYIFDELYEKGLSNEKIAEKIINMGYSKEKIRADSAERKSIDRLYDLGLKGIRPSIKGAISVGIDFLQDYEIIIHPTCVNFITEIGTYMWDEDKFGNKINKPVDDFNHLMDAMRYAIEDVAKGAVYSFN